MNDRQRTDITTAIIITVRELVAEAHGDESDVFAIFGGALGATLAENFVVPNAVDERKLFERVIKDCTAAYRGASPRRRVT